MKHIFSILLTAAVLFASFSWAMAAEAADETIPLDDAAMVIETGKTYSISTPEELYNFAAMVTDRGISFARSTVVLTSDIVLNDTVLNYDTKENSYNPLFDSTVSRLTPIGTQVRSFRGTFDGQGHSISGAYVQLYGEAPAGLFGYCENAVIRNLTLKNSYIKGTTAAALCGNAWNTTFENCTTEAVVVAKKYCAGITATAFGCRFISCTNYSDLLAADSSSASSYAGGICGLGMNGISLEDCHNGRSIISYGTVSAWVADWDDCQMDGCTNSGTILTGMHHSMKEDNPLTDEKVSDHVLSYTYSETAHSFYCTCGFRLPVTESHSFLNTVLAEPTGTQSGLIRKTCTACGYSFTEVLPPQPSYKLEVEGRKYMDYIDLWKNTAFLIAAKEGAYIKDVILNGVSLGPVTKVEFSDGAVIKVIFTEKPAEEKELTEADKARIIKGVQATTIKASTVNVVDGSIRVVWRKSPGYKMDYFQVYRSTKRNSGYGTKAFFTTKTGKATNYTNSKSLKVGTRYYYKVRGVRVIDGKKYYTQWSNKANRKAKGRIILSDPPY